MNDIKVVTKLGGTVDGVWEALGGGPADLFFPDDFEGVWEVESLLTSVDTPLGPEFVPDMQVPRCGLRVGGVYGGVVSG